MKPVPLWIVTYDPHADMAGACAVFLTEQDAETYVAGQPVDTEGAHYINRVELPATLVQSLWFNLLRGSNA